MSARIKKKSFWLLLPALLITIGFWPHLLGITRASDPADTDADGLSDAWEITHFGNLTAQSGGGDPDSDGYYNEEEESLGIDPNVAGGVPGYLSRDVWTGISGVHVGDLVNHSKFHNTPDIRELVFGSGASLGQDDYGSRLRGTVTAPVTGSYTFWIAGDDGVELWLSSDDRQYNRQRIAWHEGVTLLNQWDKGATQQSAPVQLVAGQKYYIEILHKEGHGGDHFSVAWSYEASDVTNWAREPGALASQSSLAYGGAAGRAIDGNRSGTWTQGSVTHTSSLDNSWWQVDLGADRSVEQIVLSNRTDCCAGRLSNFRISVLDSSGNEVAGQDYHTQQGYVNGSLIWDLEVPVTGRVVRVSILGRNLAPAGNGILSLAEVEVMGSASGVGSATPLGYLTNWAGEAGVLATQSTTNGGGATADRAIDGNRSGHYPSGSVTHTDVTSAGNWWQADLGVGRPINRIAIYNRTDCCMNRLSNFRISLLDSAGTVVVQEDFYSVEGHAGYRFNWDVPVGTSAQVVRIDRLGPARDGTRVLSFAEVEILGAQNLALGAIVARQPIPTGVIESYFTDSDDPDDDGLPSAWEIQYGFDPNSAQDNSGGSFGDPDGDLVANWQEYQLGTDPTVANSVPGGLTEEIWTGIPGTKLEDLYTHPKYLQGSDYRRLIYQSEGTRWVGPNIGSRIRGYLVAPSTGDYRFWLSGDDQVRFWLSTDESKFNKELHIAPHLFTLYREYDIEPSQRSRVVHLVAGQKYYIEMHQKENQSGCPSPPSLAWIPPGATQRTLIPAEHLTSYNPQSDDLDDDDLLDSWELANGLDPSDNGSTNPSNGYSGDLDGDGLLNHEERSLGTRADLADTDGDGISDLDEAHLLETDALAGDVAPFQSVQTVSGSTYTADDGGWAATGQQVYSTGVRGWIEYEINIPSAGVYLLDLAISARTGGLLSDEYEMIFSIDGHFNERLTATIAEGAIGNMKALTPWLAAGTHTVRVFNDNALTFRRINIHTLEVFSAQGGDMNSSGTPDWVEARLARLNGIDSQFTTSRVSPVCVEGRARHVGLVSLSTGGSVLSLAGERWMTDLVLDAQSPVSVQATFENGGLVQSRSINWVSTNLLAETSITLRQGDSLLLTAYNGSVPQSSENVTLTIGGQTHTFVADSPLEQLFDSPGTHVLVVSLDNGNQTVTHDVTVTVIAPMVIESPVCVPTHVREWDIETLPTGAILEMDSRVEIRDTVDLGNGITRHLISSDAPEARYANIRLGLDGPILQVVPIRGMTLRDAEHTSVQYVQDYGDGSYRVDMAVVATNIQPDIRVHYDIFIGGVVFDTGGVSKDYLPVDFDSLGQATATFIKTGNSGSNCHRTSIWQGNKRIAFFY